MSGSHKRESSVSVSESQKKKQKSGPEPNCLGGKTFLFLGGYEDTSCMELEETVEEHGGKVSVDLDSTVTHIVVGSLPVTIRPMGLDHQITLIKPSDLTEMINTLPGRKDGETSEKLMIRILDTTDGEEVSRTFPLAGFSDKNAATMKELAAKYKADPEHKPIDFEKSVSKTLYMLFSNFCMNDTPETDEKTADAKDANIYISIKWADDDDLCNFYETTTFKRENQRMLDHLEK